MKDKNIDITNLQKNHKEKFQKKILDKLNDTAINKIAKKMSKSFVVLENHIIQVQQNQVDQEAYLKDITKRLQRIENEKYEKNNE